MKNTIDLVFTLKKVPLFADIPDHIIAEIARLIAVIDMEEGKQFIKKDDVADGLFVIKTGRVKVHTDQVEICQLGENDIVGELGVLAPIRRSAHVTALEPCILYFIHREYFIQLMNEIPEITAPILHVLTDKIIKANEAYMDIRGQLE
jgi:CRP-like cAMP-binding protein